MVAPAAPTHDVPAAEGSGAAVRALEGRSVAADWGAPELLAPFTARPAVGLDGRPEAEVWFGAHPRNPSRLREGRRRPPASELPEDRRPSVLVKLLAAGGPLSIQVHPDDETAARGHAAEERAGVPVDAPGRRFPDPSGKPELIRALGPMRALCGLRPAARSRTLLTTLAPDGAAPLLESLAHGDDGLGATVELVLRAGRREVDGMIEAVADGARRVLDLPEDRLPDDVVRLASLTLDLLAHFPRDRGVLVALLLEDVDLAPGDALFVAPGTPHAYLSGLGVEVMAESDNTLRGGMTSKAVDVDGFLAVLDPRAVGAPRVGSLPRRAHGRGWRRHILPSDAFLVDELVLDGREPVERDASAPGVLLCVAGDVVVSAADGSAVKLGPGAGALLAPGVVPVEVSGAGQLVLARGRRRRPSAGASPTRQAGAA